MVAISCIYLLILSCALVSESVGLDDESVRMFSVLSEEIRNLKAENANLKAEINLCASRKELSMVKDKMESMSSSLESYAGEVRNRRLDPPTTQPAVNPDSHTVAFYAIMTVHAENLGIHQPVTFPKAITNIGQGYDPKTSLFKAPVRGVYYFSANIMTHHGEDIEVEVVKNGGNLVQTYLGNGDTYAVGTLSAVVEMDVGDDVWIRINGNKAANNGNVRIYGYNFSWFYGFRISN